MPYSPLLIKPMKEELTSIGFEDLVTPAQVDAWMKNPTGTALLVVNSVTGAAAGMARPAVRMALENKVKPTRLGTVFDEHDLEATARARGYFPDIPPSSPSIAIFKDGELVYFVPRHRIEGRSADQVANDLIGVFEEYCT
ncbi:MULTISPECIES: BrxA/BrxB family bacilliredoxin [Corallococcus]|uniref:BrxA/BrxB family bacilliredoxin n=1 Tax=Corallococcus TaxID=83461 RepID=UPI0011814762|nr:MULTISPECIES: BrxA/BrxB family bacilliredoxin [Corallococcus]NBD13061.1 BrxA/BrxB family bacilliredoxin [Corallococcus silvisoli]TSC24681.1 BrxA/BrxB family bacilliredoxin [Corallococcus sp. Z5C101001]